MRRHHNRRLQTLVIVIALRENMFSRYLVCAFMHINIACAFYTHKYSTLAYYATK